MSMELKERMRLPQFGVAASEAAAAIGVSPNTFLKMVEDGRMPRPRCIGSRKVWDVEEVYLRFKSLPHEAVEIEDSDSWSDV